MPKFYALVAILSAAILVGCKSNPHKAQDIDTKLEQANTVSGAQKVGLKNGEMVVQSKEEMSEKLRDLQNTVYSLEDKVYGTRKLKSLGLYGELKSCKRRLASRQYGGSGTLVWTEPLDRVTDKEEEFKIGLDEKKNLVGVTEEYLRDRFARFNGYKMILQKRADEFEAQIEDCKAKLAEREMDERQSSRVMVQEAAKSSYDKESIDQFMCGFVKPGASLQTFMMNAFAKGWLSLGDYKMDQNLLLGTLRDTNGSVKENCLMFNGWKLSFDRGPVTIGDLLNNGKDAQLVAWAYEQHENSPSLPCLKRKNGHWNP